jgi:hypothetical protein
MPKQATQCDYFLRNFVCSQNGNHPLEDGEKMSISPRKIYPKIITFSNFHFLFFFLVKFYQQKNASR